MICGKCACSTGSVGTHFTGLPYSSWILVVCVTKIRCFPSFHQSLYSLPSIEKLNLIPPPILIQCQFGKGKEEDVVTIGCKPQIWVSFCVGKATRRNYSYFPSIGSFLTVLIVFGDACSPLFWCHAPGWIRNRFGLGAHSSSPEFDGDREQPDIDRNDNCP